VTEPFAPSLQLPWALVEARAASFDRIVLHLTAREQQPFPDPIGRHVSAIAADPEIAVEHATADLEFRQVVLFRMCWEVAEPELGDTTSDFRGDTFRWYLESPLLHVQRDRTSPDRAARLRHYRLICGELIDIICLEAPDVLLRNSPDAT